MNASRVRWYFGVVGLIGLVPSGIACSDGEIYSTFGRVMGGVGLALSFSYLFAAVLFRRFLRSRGASNSLIAAAACFLVVLAGRALWSNRADLLIPIGLFAALPLLSVGLTLPELRAQSAE